MAKEIDHSLWMYQNALQKKCPWCFRDPVGSGAGWAMLDSHVLAAATNAILTSPTEDWVQYSQLQYYYWSIRKPLREQD